MFSIQTCCNHILSAAEGFQGGGGGAEGNVRGSRNFCQFYLVLSLFYSLQRGSNGCIAEKTLLILYQGSKGGPLFSRGDVKLFPRGGGGGVQMLVSFKKPIYVFVIFFQGGGCPNPLSPSGSAHGQCHHNGTIFITVPLLTISVRH